MVWKKLGNIYTPTPLHEKLLSHAANPLPVYLRDDVYRIFYSGRDASKRSSIGYVDFDLGKREVVYVHDRPVFQHGPAGSFYEHGVSIGNCYSTQGSTYMMFMGWQNPADGHWRGDIGRLLVGSDLSLSLDSHEPLIGCSDMDRISLSYPWVEQTVHGFEMWYGSTTTWDAGNGEMIHVLNHAHSTDGQAWIKTGQAVPHIVGVAQAFSRPTVMTHPDGSRRMWFSYRSGSGETYRIGQANSLDGKIWQLALDESGIDVSSRGWDSEMIEYPFVFQHDGAFYMLYNGNGYGQSGFGLAIYQG